MPKRVPELSAKDLRGIREPGAYAVGGVAGLYLDWRKKTSISWLLRTAGRNGKRSDFGLGSFPEVSLARARKMAASMKKKLSEGIDPRDARCRQPRRAKQKAGGA